MGLRTADKFRIDALAGLEVELSIARADFEAAMQQVHRTVALDPAGKSDEPFERGTQAWARLREHRARVQAIEQAMGIVRALSVSE